MSKLLDTQVRDAVGGMFINGSDFEQGLVLKVVKMEPVKADNPKYGAQKEGNGLKQGETWEYTFETETGVEKTFKSTSARLAGAVSRLDPEVGTKLKIVRSGTGTDTMWSAEVVE